MNYLITVSDDTIILEKIVFSYRDEAVFYAENAENKVTP